MKYKVRLITALATVVWVSGFLLSAEAYAHAIEDASGSDDGSSIINVVTYYQERLWNYPEIDLDQS